MQSIRHQSKMCLLHFLVYVFVFLPKEPWCFVIKLWYISYARHILNKIEKRHLVHGVFADSIEVHDVSSRVRFRSSYLSWTWSWLKSLLGIIYYDTHALFWTEPLLNQAFTPFCEILMASFLFDDQRSLTNVYELLLDFTDFIVVLFLLRTCHSIFSCRLHYSFHSAILSWKNKKYYTHIWNILFFLCSYSPSEK